MVDAARTFLFGEWDGVVLGNEASEWQEKYGRWGIDPSSCPGACWMDDIT